MRAVGRLGRVRRRRPGRARSRSTTRSCRRPASTARRRAGSSRTSTRRRSRSASSRATRYHPGSRGRNCAKGPATLNQIDDPERILYPLKRVGPRGSGKFERTTWDEVLDTFAAQIRTAIVEGRKTEVMYHVGRPGPRRLHGPRAAGVGRRRAQQPHERLLGARRASATRCGRGADRPSPDHANAKFILLLSSHLETGHYFNPHAQRIIDGKMAGAKLAVDRRAPLEHRVDGRLLARAVAGHRGAAAARDRARDPERGASTTAQFLEDWVNWRDFLDAQAPERAADVRRASSTRSKAHYARYTPEAAAQECGVAARHDRRGRARDRHAPAAPSRRTSGATPRRATSAAGRSRAACSSCRVLVGAVGTQGGTNLNTQDKFVPPPFLKPPPQNVWNELLYPARVAARAPRAVASCCRTSCTEGRGKIAAYFTRVYNPVWTNPDGMMWEQVLRDEIEDRAARRAHADRGARRRSTPTTCCRWASAPSATT